MAESLISEAVYEWAQALWENDETHKEDVLSMNSHIRRHFQHHAGVYHIEQGGGEIQPQLKQM